MNAISFAKAHPSQDLLQLAALLDPTGKCKDPLSDRGQVDWQGVYRLAAAHLVSPVLFVRLKERQQLHLIPEDVRNALEQLFLMNKARNKRQRHILRDTVGILNSEGIEPLLLKGSVFLLPGQTDHGAARMMSDIDLVSMNSSPERTQQVLLDAGYAHAPGQGPGDVDFVHHHLAPLFHPSGEGYVEVHRQTFVSRVPPRVIPFDELCAEAQLAEWEGLRCWVPSLKHRLLHNILHHQVQSARRYLPSLLSIRQLFDFAQLRCAAEANGLDWVPLMTRLDQLELGDAARKYLLSAELLFTQELPPGVQTDERHHSGNQRMWWWMRNGRAYEVAVLAERLLNLPRRLMTPSWYLRKLRALLRQWQQRSEV